MKNKIKKLILLIGDLGFLLLSLVLTLVIRYDALAFEIQWSNHLPKFIIVFLIFVISLYLNNFYNLNIKTWGRNFFKNLLTTTIFTTILSITYFYLATDESINPKTNLIIFIAISIILITLWRRFFALVIKSIMPKENLAIIGHNSKTEKLLEEIKNNPGSGYSSALIFKTVKELEVLYNLIKEKNIKTVVICDDFSKPELLRENLFKCLNLKVNFYNYPDFYEILSGKIPVESIGANWFIENIKEGERNYFNSTKNILDFFFAILFLLVSLPFWPIIALIIKVESKGPVFFMQKRTGRNEKDFLVYKFRTMKEENNDRKMTAKNDSRITSFGNILRKTRLDELPQVINVIKGQMSFIGPRPERPELITELEKEIPFYKTRLLVKPGLSGWDQVSGEYHSPSTEDTIKKLQNDLFYIKNRSLYLDTIIVLKTIAAVLSRSGR